MWNDDLATLLYGEVILLGKKSKGIIYDDICNSLDQSIIVEGDENLDGFRGPISIIIDGALNDLVQNNVGTNVSVLKDPKTTWDDFFNDGGLKNRSSAIQYVFMRVQLEFDSPNPNIVSILKERVQEILWRAREEYE